MTASTPEPTTIILTGGLVLRVHDEPGTVLAAIDAYDDGARNRMFPVSVAVLRNSRRTTWINADHVLEVY